MSKTIKITMIVYNGYGVKADSPNIAQQTVIGIVSEFPAIAHQFLW